MQSAATSMHIARLRKNTQAVPPQAYDAPAWYDHRSPVAGQEAKGGGGYQLAVTDGGTWGGSVLLK